MCVGVMTSMAKRLRPPAFKPSRCVCVCRCVCVPSPTHLLYNCTERATLHAALRAARGTTCVYNVHRPSPTLWPTDPVRHGRAGVSRGTAHVCGGAQLERGLLWLQRLSPGLAAQRRRVRGCQRRPHLLLCSAPHVTSSLHRPSTYHLLPPPSLNLSANLSGPYRLRPSPLLTDCGLLLCSVCCAPPLHI